MEVSQEFMVQLIAGFALGIVSIFTGLLAIMWKSISARLRTLGHEDRDIRGQMHGIMVTLTEHLSDEAKTSLKTENSRLRWMLETLGNKRKIEENKG